MLAAPPAFHPPATAAGESRAGVQAGNAISPPLGLAHVHIIAERQADRRRLHGLACRRANTVVRAYPSMAAFLDQIAELDGGCVLLACDETDTSPERLVRAMKQHPRFACIVMLHNVDLRGVVALMKAGAVNILPVQDVSESDGHVMLDAIEEALGEARQALAKAAALERARTSVARLTAREREVLIGLVEGKSNKMIAQRLAISPRTIEIYRAHLMEKLGTTSLSETLRIAFAAGLG